VRTHNGIYCPTGTKRFTSPLYRTAEQIAILKQDVDVILAESDTCPQNRYAMSANYLHSYLVGSFLEGIKGSKLWITRLENYEPQSGKAYRKCLGKYSGFYTTLKKLIDEFKPFGCCIPVFNKPYYALDTDAWEILTDGWSACFLERVGIPLYFSSDNEDTVFFEGNVDSRYTDEEIRELFKKNVVLASDTARNLNNRGFTDLLGVEVNEWKGNAISGEVICFDNNNCMKQKNCMELKCINDSVVVDSYVYHSADGGITKDYLFPGTTVYKNPLGGTSVVFAGTPVCDFYYTEGFSFLNESRKNQLIRLLKKIDKLPLYYPEDAEVYLRAGYINGGKIMAVLFNLGFDTLEELPLVIDGCVETVKLLSPCGSLEECDFTADKNNITVNTEIKPLEPAVLIIELKGN